MTDVFQSVLLPQEMHDELRRHSFALKCSTGDLIRSLLKKGLEGMETHVSRPEDSDAYLYEDEEPVDVAETPEVTDRCEGCNKPQPREFCWENRVTCDFPPRYLSQQDMWNWIRSIEQDLGWYINAYEEVYDALTDLQQRVDKLEDAKQQTP